MYGKELNSFFLSKNSQKIDFDNVSKSRNRKLKSRNYRAYYTLRHAHDMGF